nr:protein YgfX [Pseudomonas aegrilactucae]
MLVSYLACQLLALVALSLLAIALPLALLGLCACAAHGYWVLPRHILLNHPCAVTGLRRDPFGWQLFSVAGGWQAVQLRRDSLALPGLVVLRYRRAGQWFSRSLCIAPDALEPVQHRRLRVRLKFSRRRWAAAG